VDDFIQSYYCEKGSLSISKLNESLSVLTQTFSHKENILNFPPDGIPSKTNIEHFLSINKSEKIYGFYRIIDLQFENKIELHGSFKSESNFLIKGYFELTKKFVSEVQDEFPEMKITSVVSASNKSVIKFLEFLKFEKQSDFTSESNTNYLNYLYQPKHN
jgi:hypothetical protein